MSKQCPRKIATLIVGLALAVLVPLGLGGCANEEQAIKDELTAEFDALKNPTKDNLDKYLGSSLDDDSNFKQLESYGIDPYEFLGHFFKHFDYQIGDIKVDGKTATVSVTLTNVNVVDVVNQASSEYQSTKTQDELVALYNQGGEDAIVQDLFKLVYDKLDSATDTTSTDVTLSLTKGDDGWTVDSSSQEELLGAMFGGASLSTL